MKRKIDFFADSSDTVSSKKDLSLYKFIFVLILVICAMRIVFNVSSNIEFVGFSTVLDLLSKVPQPSTDINNWFNSLNVESDIPALELLGNFFLKPFQFLGFLVAGIVQLVTTIGYLFSNLLF